VLQFSLRADVCLFGDPQIFWLVTGRNEFTTSRATGEQSQGALREQDGVQIAAWAISLALMEVLCGFYPRLGKSHQIAIRFMQ
jgi:hypothetical protein